MPKRSRYPPNRAVPSKDSSASSADEAVDNAEQFGFRNKTTLELVIACLNAGRGEPTKKATPDSSQDNSQIDNTGPYGLSKDAYSRLLKLEVVRLLECVDNNGPLRFDSNGASSHGKDRPLLTLRTLLYHFIYSLVICRLDTESLFVENCEDLVSPKEFARSQRLLRSRVESFTEKKTPHVLDDGALRCYHELVNYLTAVIARLCIRSISVRSYHTRLIANLAALRVKLKTLAENPLRNAEVSLEMAEEAAEHLQAVVIIENQGVWGPKPIDDDMHESRAANYNAIAKKVFSSEDDRSRTLHYVEMSSVRDGIFLLLNTILFDMLGHSQAGKAPSLDGQEEDSDIYKISSLVIGAGFSSHPTLISEDPYGELGASSQSQCLRISYNAYQMLMLTSNALKNGQNPTGPSPAAVHWEFLMQFKDETLQQNRDCKAHFTTSNMDTAISLMVPLICCTAEIPYLVIRDLYVASVINDADDGVIETSKNIKFEALAVLEFKTPGRPTAHSPDPNISALSNSAIIRELLPFDLTDDLANGNGTSDAALKGSGRAPPLHSERHDLQAIGRRIQRQWVIDQDAIKVPCVKYGWSVLAGAFLLVAGGIALGFTVENRIPGVDPFNITLFCWIIAGFLVLVAKSLKVQDWSWRDFFKQRCVCRSVTELSSATRIDPQLIIAYLLHNEESTILRVKGPFSTPFTHRSVQGFAIDVKPTLRTLLLSGFLAVKVATLKGPMLALLQVPKGMTYEGLRHSHHPGSEDEPKIVCQERPLIKDDKDDESRKDKEPSDFSCQLSRSHWHKLFGIYNDVESTFS